TRVTKKSEGYRETAEQIGSRFVAGSIVIGPWTMGVLFEHYNAGRCPLGNWIDASSFAGTLGDERRNQAFERLRATLAAGREVWLLKPAEPEVAAALEGAGYS